jgi:outer membrane protein assembly factor BamB
VDLIGRDAFNGVPLWRATTGLVSGDRPHEWVAADGLVFHFPRRNPCFAVATDIRTGITVREFTNGLQRPLPAGAKRVGGRPGMAVMLVCGKTLVQGYGRQVAALDIATGAPRWQAELQRELGAMVATPDGRRVFVHEVEDWDRGWARWGKHQTVAVTCLLAGQTAWRNTELAGQEISDLIHDGGALYAFDPTTNLGDDGDADIFKLAADTGALTWAKKGPKHNYNIFLNNAVVRGAEILAWGSFNNLRSFAVSNGEERNLTINGYNQRCTRMSATRDWLVFGLTTWVDRELNWTQSAVGRSDCAYPAFLAQGQTFFTYNLACSCINPLRGIVALAPEENAALAPDARRKQVMAAPVAGQQRQFDAPAKVITAEWKPDSLLFYFLDETTPPVEAGGLKLVADVHRHTLTAAQDGKEAWRFTAGGRIYGPPLINRDRCYVASADGWIYCLDTVTGVPRWRFLAAPRERKVVAYGQLENTWPVYNVVLHEDAVCAAAGRHAELDGGIFLWGLNPATGAVKWKATLHTPPAKYPAGAKPPRNDRTLMREVASVTPLNGGLASEEGRLMLVSPLLKKSGSSNSKWGYFENPPDQGRGALQARRIEIRPGEWNGKTINPQELVEIKKK